MKCKPTKINWPEMEELILLTEKFPMTKVGEILGVSDLSERLGD